MTISTTTRTAGPFICNGITSTFPFSFKVFEKDDVTVLKSDGTTEIPLVLNSDYKVILNADQDNTPGGTVVTLGVPVGYGFTLALTSSVSEKQEVSLTNNGGFYPKVIEKALDRGIVLIQQLRTIVDRSLHFPLSDTGVRTELPGVAQRANMLLSFDATGAPKAVAPVAGTATALQLLLGAVGGAALIGTAAAGQGSTPRTVQDKERDIVSVLDFMSDLERADYRAGTLGRDVTDSYQRALDAISAAGGGEVFAPDGLAKTTKGLVVTGSNVRLRLAHNAGLSYNTPENFAIKFMGPNCAVEGGLGRGFIGPAVFDGANVAPTYGVIQFHGDASYARTRLTNVKKVGLWFKDVINGTAEGCIIDGNYPSALWDNIGTGHWGVLFDPSANTTAGNFKLLGNTIRLCVQGCSPANYGPGQVTQGFVAVANIFEACWNHGIYSNFTSGAIIAGNSFNRCQIPVVVSGSFNNVSGNTMYTLQDAAGDERDVIGIDVRDGCGNIVANNTIKGTANASRNVCINIQDVSGLSKLEDNIVTGNTIDISAGTCVGIRIVGSSNAVSRNIVRGNTVRTPGKPGEGAISLYGLGAGLNLGNKVDGNIILLGGDGYGIYSTFMTAANFSGNTVEWGYDAPAPSNVTSIALFNGTDCSADDNLSVVRPTFGANLGVFGVREFGVCLNNRTRNNRSHVDVTKGASFTPIQPLNNSGLLIDQDGIGAPANHARVGSIWRRTDGGPNSAVYMKESGTDANGWIAIDGVMSNQGAVGGFSVGAGATVSSVMNVAGCTLGQFAQASVDFDLTGLMLIAYVSAAGTVKVDYYNRTAAPVAVPNHTLRVQVRRVL